MKAYFLRRLLLIPPTLLGITLLVFAIVRLAPGGPVEQGLAKLMGGEGGKRSRAEASASLTPAQVLQVEEDYDRDKGILRSYFEWLGVAPRDRFKNGRELPPDQDRVLVPVPGTVHEIEVRVNESLEPLMAMPEVPAGRDAAIWKAEWEEGVEGWQVRVLSPELQEKRWKRWMKGKLPEEPRPRVVIYKPGFDGLLQGSLGRSSKYDDPVGRMILDRIPVSLFFGGVSMVLIYGICLPLGVLKAIKHRSWIDNLSSVLVFTGYAVPGYALGALLVVYLGSELAWFPLGGFRSDDFETLSLWGKVKDLAWHGAMPLACYVISAFAMMTMLMKNNLMDNLAADYVRTATAKGAGFRRSVFRHAFRNSIIPIATTFGGNVLIFVTGSILIERVFGINGFGLLSFSALLEFDEPVIMGVLLVSSTLMLLGNVISDLCVALVDPRVSYK